MGALLERLNFIQAAGRLLLHPHSTRLKCQLSRRLFLANFNLLQLPTKTLQQSLAWPVSSPLAAHTSLRAKSVALRRPQGFNEC